MKRPKKLEIRKKKFANCIRSGKKKTPYTVEESIKEPIFYLVKYSLIGIYVSASLSCLYNAFFVYRKRDKV
jgi:hypothetical protein